MRSNKVNVLKNMLGMLMIAPIALSLSLFAADPVNHWALDETSGSTYVDSIGGANGTCTEPGCPSPISGIVNGAQDFNGTESDMINVQDTANFDWTADANVTIEFWMKSVADNSADNDMIIGRTSTFVAWYVAIAPGGFIRAAINNDTGTNFQAVTSSTVIADGQWNHIAYVVKPGQVRVYVNGEYDFNITRTNATDLIFDTNVTIGNLDFGGGDWTYTGQLDDIKVYATDLNGSTIKEHYNNVVNPDLTAPTLAEVTAVTSPTDDNTPDYTFSSDEAGMITYGGSCTSATTAATDGNNTITFDTLADGVYGDCTITVTDAAGNPSTPLAVTEFVVDTTVPTDPTDPTDPTVPTDPTDPTVPTDPIVSDSDGGGCTYNPDSKNFDMMFLVMIALGLFYPFRRRFIK